MERRREVKRGTRARKVKRFGKRWYPWPLKTKAREIAISRERTQNKKQTRQNKINFDLIPTASRGVAHQTRAEKRNKREVKKRGRRVRRKRSRAREAEW